MVNPHVRGSSPPCTHGPYSLHILCLSLRNINSLSAIGEVLLKESRHEPVRGEEVLNLECRVMLPVCYPFSDQSESMLSFVACAFSDYVSLLT